MRFNKKDYEKAEQFFNGETKWRDTWAEQAMSKDYEDDWETFQKIEEQQKFVKMSVTDWGKVRKLLLEAAEDDLIRTEYSDKHVLPPFRAWACEPIVRHRGGGGEAT